MAMLSNTFSSWLHDPLFSVMMIRFIEKFFCYIFAWYIYILLMQHLHPTEIRKEKYSDFVLPRSAKIQVLKQEHYCVVEGYSIMGEAPKSFIRVYEGETQSQLKIAATKSPQKSRHLHFTKFYRTENKLKLPTNMGNLNTWTLYLAKTGHKWYPIESITEHLIARVGAVLGLNMAKSRLVKVSGQVKFLSKYFLNPEQGQELVHGIDILAAYVDDRAFVEEIAVKKKERVFFTLEDTVAAIEQVFPSELTTILESFFIMLCFDAWVGVQDRHFQNWGVVRDIYGEKPPYFSPIYDSARGLFWNQTENKISEWAKAKQFEQQAENQIKNSVPQFTLRERQKINHFDLAEVLLCDEFLPLKSVACKIFTDEGLNRVQRMIRREFRQLLSRNRVNLICKCLEIRHHKFSKLLI